jgi:S1-C subfamily serine protease
MAQKGDSGTEDKAKQATEKSLGGPFEPPASPDPNAINTFLHQLNQPGSANCESVYKSHKDASQLTALQFDSCYYGQTHPSNGKSLELKTPVMQPGADGNPHPQLEKITTEGLTMDSRRLDVFTHALPAVRPVSFTDGQHKVAGTASMIASDGLMVTNKHVVDGSNGTLQVSMLNPDGSEEMRTAHVVKLNPQQDLALLQVERKPGETFAALPLSQGASWREREPTVEMGNANGEGKISMAKARYGGMVNQEKIPFDQQPPDVAQGRTMLQTDATIPHGYSGGVLLSVPGSEKDSNGHVERLGTSAIRGITDYSNLEHKAYVIPADRVQHLLDEYRKEQAQKAKSK